MKNPEKLHFDYDEIVSKYPVSSHFTGLLHGRTALISGGSRGIGLAIAREFLAASANVIVTGTSREHLEKAQQEAGSAHLKTMLWDVADMSVMEENFRKAQTLFEDPISILVNNAGIQTPKDYDRDFFAIREEDYDRVQNINLKGMFFMSQMVARYMIENGIRGNILNTASVWSYMPALCPYEVTKWGVKGFTQGLALKLAPYGIIVNGFAPGHTTTDMARWSKENGIDDDVAPNRRFGVSEEMAAVALMLVSDVGRNIVGDIVVTDSGTSLLGHF